MTAKLATIDKTAASVVTVLENAKTWLSTAVEMTGPEEIAAAKAHIKTAETYARELGLSKDIQQDAQEMVRRAEYALGKSIRKGQSEGTIVGPEGGRPVTGTGEKGLTRVADLLPHGGAQAATYAMADGVSEERFEAAIDEAKSEGNLSRANVVRKVQGDRTPPRRALTDQAFDAFYDLTKAVERVQRIADDDRFPQNAEKVAAKHRSDLLRAIDGLQSVINRLPSA